MSEDDALLNSFVSRLEPIGSIELPRGDLTAMMLQYDNIDSPLLRVGHLIRNFPNLIAFVHHRVHIQISCKKKEMVELGPKANLLPLPFLGRIPESVPIDNRQTIPFICHIRRPLSPLTSTSPAG